MIYLCTCDKEEILKDIDFNQALIEQKSLIKVLQKQIKKNIPNIFNELLKYYNPVAIDKKL